MATCVSPSNACLFGLSDRNQFVSGNSMSQSSALHLAPGQSRASPFIIYVAPFRAQFCASLKLLLLLLLLLLLQTLLCYACIINKVLHLSSALRIGQGWGPNLSFWADVQS